jgi:hypothetical protein
MAAGYPLTEHLHGVDEWIATPALNSTALAGPAGKIRIAFVREEVIDARVINIQSVHTVDDEVTWRNSLSQPIGHGTVVVTDFEVSLHVQIHALAEDFCWRVDVHQMARLKILGRGKGGACQQHGADPGDRWGFQ